MNRMPYRRLPAALAFAACLVSSTAVLVAADKPRDTTDARLRQILREDPLIDGHNDIPWQYRLRANDLGAIDLAGDTRTLKRPLSTDIPRLRRGGVGGVFWSVYVPVTLRGEAAVRATFEQIDVVHRLCAKHPDALELVRKADDIERIHRAGRIASLIGMEGGHSIDNSLGNLRKMHALGARYMSLTHAANTDWADAATDEPRARGLTAFGEDVVREMNRLGMLVDLSHVSKPTMLAAMTVSKAPVIFSHSSARALCDHPRNVDDETLRLLRENGGVIMINFFPGYLVPAHAAYAEKLRVERKRLQGIHGDNFSALDDGLAEWRQANPPPPNATLGDVADHLDHVLKVAGEDHVGLGSDFDGITYAPKGLEDVSCYPALFAELQRRRWTRDEMKKLAGRNILRVMHVAERVAQEQSAK
ncbi:MAG: membrane dipeptidase [Verrucomicrobia bacterium]|nr:membrane dipeptidase [Verrucomicrobiota bacterium]